MKRILVAAACLIPFALAAEASINRNSPEAAVKAAYAADETAIQGHGPGVMSDNTLRARFFSRSLLRSIAANELLEPSSPAIREPFSDEAPHLVALKVAPISETGDQARVMAEFARGDGARERLTYAMVFERDQWRINDILYTLLDGESHTLRGTLAVD